MLITRILTGGILGVAVVSVTLFAPTVAVVAVLGILWVVGAGEWARLASLGPAATFGFVAAHVAAVAGLGFAGFSSTLVAAAIWFAVPAIGLAAAGMVRFPTVFPNPVIALTGLLSLVPSWLAVGYLHDLAPGLCLAAIVIIWGADVGAYAAGRTLGRRKLAPAISPGKTWEGAAGGLVVATVIALIASALLALPPSFVVLGAAAAAVSVLGDLGVSLLKRHAGLKDSGRLLPGHGGALDRIDGLTTGLPIIAIGLQLVALLD